MNPSSATNRPRGIALMLGAGLCWSLGGIIVRSLTLTDVWEIVFWRAFFMLVFLAVLLLALRRRGAISSVRVIGVVGMLSGACLAAQIYFFILALSNTTAANTFVLMSLSPLFAALAGWLFLRERVAWHTWIAIAFALGGIAVMFGEGISNGRWLGNVFALCVPLGYACQIIFVRKVQGRRGQAPDLLPDGDDACSISGLAAGSVSARHVLAGTDGLRATGPRLLADDAGSEAFTRSRNGVAGTH